MNSPIPSVAEYKRLRAVSQRLADKLVKRVGTETLHECAAALDMLSRGTIVFSSEDEMPILYDFCIYQHRVKGKNIAERFMEETPPDAGSDEMAALQAALTAYYSIFEIVGIERGAGIHVNDRVRGGTGFLSDIGLSNSARIGAILATRVVLQGGLMMTTGAAIPMNPGQFAAIKSGLEGVVDLDSSRTTQLSATEETALATAVIRKALRLGYSSHIAYTEPGAPAPAGRLLPKAPAVTGRRAGRNDPCPCGSGKKFKVCCGRA